MQTPSTRTPIRDMTCAEIEAFVDAGEDVNIVEVFEHPYFEVPTTKSLLERAVELDCVELARLLIARGATLKDEPREDFDVSAQWRNGHFVSKALPLAITNPEKLNGNCYLFLWSLNFRSIPMCQLLYEALVVPQESRIREKTLLAAIQLTVRIGDLALLDFVLAHGGERVLNLNENLYTSPLHIVCCTGDIEMAGILLRAGAEPNVKTSDGGTPLTDAIFNNHEEIALLLIENGADVAVQLKDRARPLSMAKKRKMRRVVAAIEAKLSNPL